MGLIIEDLEVGKMARPQVLDWPGPFSVKSPLNHQLKKKYFFFQMLLKVSLLK